MAADSGKWFVIVNPVAGSGRGLDHFPQISKHLRDAHILCEPVFTEHKFHATELTVTAVREGYRRIIVVGGDGTLHEVVNGLFIQQEVCPDEVLVAVVAVGTGNDWVRTFGISNRYQDAVKAISEGYSFLQDVGVVSYEEAHYRQSRYMANVAGAGFDAHVVRKLSHLKKKGHRSRWRYTWCLVKNFFRYKSTGVKVWVDGRLVYNNLLLSAAVGICKFNGGGLQQLPEAVADDGMLDLSLIRPVHFWHLLFRFHYLFNGGIYRIRHILQERGSRIRIESSPEVSVEIDGEPLGHTPLDSPPGHPHRRGPRFLPAVRRRRGGDPGRVARSRKKRGPDPLRVRSFLARIIRCVRTHLLFSKILHSFADVTPKNSANHVRQRTYHGPHRRHRPHGGGVGGDGRPRDPQPRQGLGGEPRAHQ